ESLYKATDFGFASCATSVKIQGSNDGGATWTDIWTVPFAAWTAALQSQTWSAYGPDFAPHTHSNNIGLGYYVKASSNASGGDPWRAFNGSITGASQSWLGSGSGGDWLSVDVGSSYLLNAYSIAITTVPEATRAPKTWTMEGSNDGSTWAVLDTVTNQTAWATGETRTFVY